ncbi:hypothetical protein FIBSPDRAFT_839181 [Athelia psychrophila]|uniref:Uncharacterized protein n=1 Tax=Athelia psychrophila TaxID=1759441 RepID=A0A165YMY1_9AGAM|nr:hypothetical protein FIBSPDRAFT_839181 [Fibularhizoctonia sp. CBS 109695]
MSFTVHNYWNSAVASDHEQPTATSLLEAGRHAIEMIKSSSGWSNVPFVPSAFAHDYTLHTNVYELAKAPPKAHSDNPPENFLITLEWGAPAQSSDAFSLEMLPEFESTDLVYLAAGDSDSSQLSFPTLEQANRPKKRRRLDNEYLHHIIPQPHYRPSSAEEPSPRDLQTMSIYKRLRAVAIPPYDLARAKEHLNTPYTRSAWIIPVRGKLPWYGSTPAVMLDSLDDNPPSGPIPGSDEHVLWSHTALRCFWDFLLSLQQLHVFGYLSISFHAASPSTDGSKEAESSMSSGYSNRGQVSTDMNTASVPYANLLGVDQIKLYHDSQHAMRIRNVLDAWAFQPPRKVDNTAADKIRMLKGARLALVDECSGGILHC